MERVIIRENWELDSLYPGGLDSPELVSHLQITGEEMSTCEQVLAVKGLATAELAGVIRRLHQVGLTLLHTSGFVEMLLFKDLRNEKAQQLTGQMRDLQARHGALLKLLDGRLLQLSEAEWQALGREESMPSLIGALALRRHQAAEMLPPGQEAVIKTLAVDGHSGWTDIYQAVTGRTTITYEHEGQTKSLPLSSADKLLLTSPDRALRATIFREIIAAREAEVPVLAPALNHLAGYRVAMYKLRRWDSVLKEPLMIHQMRIESLEAMFAAIERNRGPVDQYLARKAHLLGDKRLRGWDLRAAPLPGEAPAWEYPAVAEKVVQYFTRFRPEMGQFARTAFAEGHIDATEGQGRQPGLSASYPLPLARSHRIFLNHQQLPMVVGHELGHSYSYIYLADTPIMANWLPPSMVLMEIPSTFAQLLVQKGLAEEQVEPAARLQRLNDLANTAVTELVSRRVQYEFEKALYEARWQGPLSAVQITELYQGIQQRVWGESVSDLNPYGWVNNMLLGVADLPFYNFPYTAALLISAGLYARWKEEGEVFASQYPQIMRDIGLMDVEEFGRRHLGVDLTQREAWQKGIDLILSELHEFLRVTA